MSYGPNKLYVIWSTQVIRHTFCLNDTSYVISYGLNKLYVISNGQNKS